MTFFFAWFGFSVLFGAFAASFLNPLHSFVLFGILIFASLCFRVYSKKLRDFSAVVLAVALGFFIVAFELITEFYPAAALDGTSGSITGTVTEVSVSGGNPVFTVKTDSIDIEGAPQKIALKLSGWDENAAKPYDKIFCKVSFAAYGEKDGTEFITDRSRGISVYAYSKEALEVTGEDRTFPGYIIYRIREEISSVIYEYFIGWHAPFMEQILIGTRGKLESEITETFRQSGISHILAVSGLHMVIVIFLFEKLI
ncbi:MAG: ComEC family DNA internalization-related competence protein, partial [Oscillospiraceae bacterium]|nr:ComEC family DNA internalization-related competence protein [Oscillospiraceae bacterium]